MGVDRGDWIAGGYFRGLLSGEPQEKKYFVKGQKVFMWSEPEWTRDGHELPGE